VERDRHSSPPPGGSVQPAPQSAAQPTIAEDADGLRVSVRVKRDWWQRLFYGFWLFGWTIGEIAVAGVLLSKKVVTADDLFLVVWLVGWTLAGSVVWGLWLWQMWGRRELLVGPTTLTLRSLVLGQSRNRAFDLARVRKVRAVETQQGIAFDYDGKTYKFGGSLDQAAQQRLIAAILQRKPSAKPVTRPMQHHDRGPD
jgi:hypothetical protein